MDALFAFVLPMLTKLPDKDSCSKNICEQLTGLSSDPELF
jgi:hypothetical protein